MDSSPPTTPNADVRMRGFARRTTVADALAWIDGHSQPLSAESVGIWQAVGRVLAVDVTSRVSVPQFVRSMMDGYAVRASDTQGATGYSPLVLSIVGQSLPGRPFVGEVQPGQAVRIMTGAPLPAGADAVLPAEQAEEAGDLLRAQGDVPPGKNISRAGEDVAAGATVQAAGRVLRPQDVGVLSSIGCQAVEVVRQPRVRLVITGNEVLPAGSVPADCRIADANGPMLAALVTRDGGMLASGKRELPDDLETKRAWNHREADTSRSPGDYLIPDDPAAILTAMQADADVVIVSGGSSVGQEDHAPMLLAQYGELAIHGIAMRPSSPTGMGVLDGRLVFLLPGNPVSCLCAYDFFAGRAIRRLGGRSSDWLYRQVTLPLARKLVSQVGRVDYARVRIVGGEVEPIAISGASILTSTTMADGFVVVPADSEGFPAGASVNVHLYD
jgi:molybdopterin molybdotransferase